MTKLRDESKLHDNKSSQKTKVFSTAYGQVEMAAYLSVTLSEVNRGCGMMGVFISHAIGMVLFYIFFIGVKCANDINRCKIFNRNS